MGKLKLNIYKVQIVYIFKEGSNFKTFGVVSSLYGKLKDVFKNGEPQTIPVPNDAPAEIPRCVWNDVNTKLNMSKQSLDLSINIPLKFSWRDIVLDIGKRINDVFVENEISIDRIGFVTEIMSEDDLHCILSAHVDIDKFKEAKEVNISWLENDGKYNIWTYIAIDDAHDLNKITIDINNLQEYKLSEQGISAQEALEHSVQKLERKMLDVL